MRKILCAWVVVVSIFMSVLNTLPSYAAYPNAPDDLTTLENKIEKSLVLISWEQNVGLGFAGSFNLSQEERD